MNLIEPYLSLETGSLHIQSYRPQGNVSTIHEKPAK